jgi:hypothetical protein
MNKGNRSLDAAVLQRALSAQSLQENKLDRLSGFITTLRY